MRKREALGEQHRRAQGQSKEHRRQVCLSIIHDDFLVAAAGPAETLMQLPLGEITLQ